MKGKELLKHMKKGKPFCLGVTENAIEARRIMDATRRWVARNNIPQEIDIHWLGGWIMAVWKKGQNDTQAVTGSCSL